MAAFATILSIATYTGLVCTIPPPQCFANFNWNDCGKSPQPVVYYWKTGSRCEVGIWRGCLPNINMFKDEYECVSTCIFTVRAAGQDWHQINAIEEDITGNMTDYEDMGNGIDFDNSTSEYDNSTSVNSTAPAANASATEGGNATDAIIGADVAGNATTGKADSKIGETETELNTEPDTATEPDPDTNGESGDNITPESDPDTKGEPGDNNTPESDPDTKGEPGDNITPESEPDTKGEPGDNITPESEPDAEGEPGDNITPESKPDAEGEPGDNITPESAPDTEGEPGDNITPESEPVDPER